MPFRPDIGVAVKRSNAIGRDPVSPHLNIDVSARHGIGPVDHVSTATATRNTLAIGLWPVEINRKRSDRTFTGISYVDVDAGLFRNNRDVLKPRRENIGRTGLAGHRGTRRQKERRHGELDARQA